MHIEADRLGQRRGMTVANTHNAPHYAWGSGCDGWRLLDAQGLSVIEERMPPGTAEVWHYHEKSNQLFYVLEGRLTLTLEDDTALLGIGDALNVPPNIRHQARNESENAVRFLVISAPATSGDRYLV